MQSSLEVQEIKQEQALEEPFKLPLRQKREIAANTYELSFGVDKKIFHFKPGQYMHITIPLAYYDPKGNSRDFSIASSPNDHFVRIAFRNSGSGFKKTLLRSKHITAQIRGPFGMFTLPKDTARPLVLIAGGIGITPFMSMIKFIIEEKLSYPITLIYINKDKQSAAFLHELSTIDSETTAISCKFHFRRLNQRALKRDMKDLHNPAFYIAGQPEMVEDTKQLLLKLGVSEKHIKQEDFPGYHEELNLVQEEEIDGYEDEKKLGQGIEGELAHRSLSDLEALLQALNNTAIVSETNASGAITFVNDKFIELSKYSREELIGQNHRILKSGYHSKAFYENMWATITRGTLWRGQMKNKAKDGSFYWVDTSIAPIIRDGKPSKYISVRFPITERQLAEEQLQERAKQQNVLTILSQEALANYDLTTLFDTATNLLAQTLSVDFCFIEKLLPDGKSFVFESGVGWHNVKRGETIISASSTESLAGFTIARKEYVIVEELSIESRFAGASILHDHQIVSGLSVIIRGNDRPFGIVGVFTTKKRTFLPEDINFLQAVANLLANAVRNQLDKRKDEFLGLASHELRTPLTSTKTFVQLLQKHAKKQKDEQSILFLSKIDTQLSRLSGLIGDLLDISRINTGKLEYNDEQFFLSDLVTEVIKEQQLFTQKHKIVLKNGIRDKVCCDRVRIAQVIENLLANAIKYSPENQKILVTTYKEHDKVIVSVKDFGVGIPKSDLPHVFERFFRGNGKRKDEFPGGLGLGLYLGAQIVKKYDGQIWVESKEGEGSTFSFSLPINNE